MPLPFVTIGVPVYKGQDYLAETLKSIQSQSYKNLNVLISLDGPNPRCEEICHPFLKDSRFQLIVQPKQLGWVKHINWLMSQAKTPFWYCHPQDDLVSSEYVQVLLSAAEKMPNTAVTYCDIKTFGNKKRKIIRPSVLGNPVVRQLQILLFHQAAVAFRGLTRVEALRNVDNIQANEVDSYSSDTVWLAALARWGNLQRIPKVMYYKRYHSNNEHIKWTTWPKEKIIKAWTIHCLDMLEQAMLVEANYLEKELFWWATTIRLYSKSFGFFSIANFTSSDRIKLFEDFLYYARSRRNIEIPNRLNKLESFVHKIKEVTQN